MPHNNGSLSPNRDEGGGTFEGRVGERRGRRAKRREDRQRRGDVERSEGSAGEGGRKHPAGSHLAPAMKRSSSPEAFSGEERGLVAVVEQDHE